MPSFCVVAAVASCSLLVHVDRAREATRGGVAFTGGPSSAREVLATIAGSMLTFTGLVFSITIVALQLTSSQFSPRVLGNFLRDRSNQWSLGILLGTFAFALFGLREVRGEDGVADQFVPAFTITVAFALVALSIATFIYFIHHLAQSLRVVNIVAAIGDETSQVIDRLHPARSANSLGPLRTPLPVEQLVTAQRSGVVLAVDLRGLVEATGHLGCDITLIPKIGDFVVEGAGLLALGLSTGSDSLRDEDENLLRRLVFLASEREVRSDVAFGFRQLVDIAEKALSPGINDPSTAVQCLDQLHRLLRILGTRPWPPNTTPGSGSLVVTVRRPSWEEYVSLALDEVRHWGAGSIQIHVRIAQLLEDLHDAVPEERRPPLRRQLQYLTARRAELPEIERDAVRRSRTEGS